MPQNPSANSIDTASPPRRLESCPLNDGLAVVDQLLAAIIHNGEADALDGALDFRLLLAHAHDPAAVLRGYFILRNAIEESHYLACYRLRRWLENQFVALVQIDRGALLQRVALTLNVPSFGALYERCATTAADGLPPQTRTRVRFDLADRAAA